MTLPKDPVLLKSLLNTLLRDEYDSPEALAEGRDIPLSALLEAMEKAGLRYDGNTNRLT